jgi:hypothetical protein
MFTNAIVVAGFGLAVLVLTTVTWFRLAIAVAIPNNRTAFLMLWAFAAVLGVSSFFSENPDWLSGILGTLATVGGIGLLFLYMLRKQGVGEPISVGDKMPEFTAVDEKGLTFESTTTAGSPILVKFFRGHW